MSSAARAPSTVERGSPPVRPGQGESASEHRPVADIQRARLLAAAMRAASEQGVAAFTVASVVERAGVSRRTFYELFHDSEDCLLAAIDDAVEQARARALAAHDAAQGGWRERTRAALAALLAFFDEHPDMAQLLVVEWLGAGPRALEQRSQLVDRMAAAIDRGRGRASGRPQPPGLTGEAVVGGVASVLHARLLGAPAGRLAELTSPLMSLIVLPYLGQAAARRELECPAPAVAGLEGRAAASGGGDSAGEQIGIRVTYRTVLVLRALAVHPGGSNREIAQAAEIVDQGQISKLLRRLERAGLVENRTGAEFRGAPNAWMLTAKGEQVERSLRP